MGDIAKRLSKARNNKELSQEKISRELDISINTYRRWEHGDTLPRANVIARIAELLEVSLEWLLTGKDKGLIRLIKELPTLPLLGEISADFTGLTNEVLHEADRIPVPKAWVDRGALYVIRVVGESMIGAGIHPGDLVGIQPIIDSIQIVPGNGRIYALLVLEEQDDRGVMLKRLEEVDGTLWAVPDNPTMRQRPLESLGTEVRVFGRVVASIRYH